MCIWVFVGYCLWCLFMLLLKVFNFGVMVGFLISFLYLLAWFWFMYSWLLGCCCILYIVCWFFMVKVLWRILLFVFIWLSIWWWCCLLLFWLLLVIVVESVKWMLLLLVKWYLFFIWLDWCLFYWVFFGCFVGLVWVGFRFVLVNYKSLFYSLLGRFIVLFNCFFYFFGIVG